MDLITIATFSNSIEAHISRSLLESQGIACFLKDEHTINANPMYHLALGGIKLQVWEKDVNEAMSILKAQQQPEPTQAAGTYKNYDDRLRWVIFILFIIGIVTGVFLGC